MMKKNQHPSEGGGGIGENFQNNTTNGF